MGVNITFGFAELVSEGQILAYSPLGRGLLTGAIRSTADLAVDDFRKDGRRRVGAWRSIAGQCRPAGQGGQRPAGPAGAGDGGAELLFLGEDHLVLVTEVPEEGGATDVGTGSADLASMASIRAATASSEDSDIHLGTGAHVLAHGKGRKDRITPLDHQTVAVLRGLLTAVPTTSDGFVFTTRTGTRMSRDAVAARLTLHAEAAAASCPTLTGKTITPHV